MGTADVYASRRESGTSAILCATGLSIDSRHRTAREVLRFGEMPPPPRSPLLTSKELEQLLIAKNARSVSLECSLDLQVSTSTVEIGPIDWAWDCRRFPYPDR